MHQVWYARVSFLSFKKKVKDLDNFAKFEFLGHSNSYGKMGCTVEIK